MDWFGENLHRKPSIKTHEDRAIAQVVNSGATAMEKGRGDLKQSMS